MGSDGAAKFIAVVSREGDGGFRMRFPDIPGRCGFARTFEEASRAAAETLTLILDEAERNGVDMPEPSSFTTILSNPRYRDGIAIRVTPLPRRAKVAS